MKQQINSTIKTLLQEGAERSEKEMRRAKATNILIEELQKIDKLFASEETTWNEAKNNTSKIIIDECTCEKCLDIAHYILTLELTP
jgi:hypothetical protein